MKHKIQITIDDRKLMFILAVIISASAIGLVVAYGGSNPQVMGHSWGEIVCDNTLCANSINGRVGIGTTNPGQKLDVVGQIHATGDICTDAGGGRCLGTTSPTNWDCMDFQISSTSDSWHTAQANCPADRKVIGGRCDWGWSWAICIIREQGIADNGYRCKGWCDTTFTMTAYARCCK